jgi:hypothetical protein
VGERQGMKIQVKLKNEDSSEKYLYRARTMEIKIGTETTLKTPFRAVTNSELNAKSKLPTEIPIDSNTGAATIKFTTGKNRNIESFMENCTSYNQLRCSLIKQKYMMQHFPLSYFIFQPTKDALSYLIKKDIRESFVIKTINLQMDLGMDIVSIPWVNMPPGKLVKIIQNYKSRSPDKEFVPFIDLEDNTYVAMNLDALSPLIDTQELKFIGNIYRKVESHRPSYDSVWNKLYDKNVAILLSDVQRTSDSIMYPTASASHHADFVLGDVFSSYVSHPIQPEETDRAIEEQIKFFDSDKLDVEKLSSFKKKPNWIEDIRNTIGDQKIENILQNYGEAQSDNEKREVLRAVSKVHELKESTKEFSLSQNYINQRDSIDYIKSKDSLNKIFQAAHKQQSISDF